MLPHNLLAIAAGSAACLVLSACDGGGSTSTAFIPPPPVTPTPTPTPSPADVPAGAVTSFDIFDKPPSGNFTVAGAAADGGLGDPKMLATASIAASDQPQMRYDAATNTYQVQFPGGAWSTLWVAKDAMHPDSMAIGKTNAIIGFNIYPRPGSGDAYSYSRIAWYSGPSTDHFGTMALGIPTPMSAVPVSGTARYDGVISGTTDIFSVTDGFEGWPTALGVAGTVTLSLDFSKGTVDGSMEPMLGTESLGVYTFKNGVYSAGAYSGQFDTTVNGINGFNGKLTGPNAEELIGGWALPFHYSGDGQDHQAVGAWMAKK